MPIAAVTAAVPGIPQAAGRLPVEVVLTAAGLALLFPVLQYALDLLGLRHTTQTAFDTLMALEPAVGVLLGLVVLSQEPSPVQLLGIATVVVAGAAAHAAAGAHHRQTLPAQTATSRSCPFSPWSPRDPRRPARRREAARSPASPCSRSALRPGSSSAPRTPPCSAGPPPTSA